MNQRSTTRQRRWMRLVAFTVSMFVVIYLTVVEPDKIQPPIVALIVVLLGAALAATPKPREKSTDERRGPGRGNGQSSIDAARGMVEKALAALESALESDTDDEGSLSRSVLRLHWVPAGVVAVQHG